MNVDDLRNPFIVASYQGPGHRRPTTTATRRAISSTCRTTGADSSCSTRAIRKPCGKSRASTPSCAGREQRGHGRRLGRLSVLPLRHGRHQRHQQRALRAARSGRRAFPECRASSASSARPRAPARSAANARLTVRRNGGFAGAVSIDYATSDLTATTGADYTAAGGTLSWPAGDMSDRTITVPLVNDSRGRSEREFPRHAFQCGRRGDDRGLGNIRRHDHER